MLRLTSRAMAQFTRQRCISTKLVFHFPTMTIRLIFDREVFIILMNLIRSSILPSVGLRNRLERDLDVFGFAHDLTGEASCSSRYR